LALGLAAVFFVAVVLGLGAAFFAAGLAAAFCEGVSTDQDQPTSEELTLAAGLAAAGFAAGLAAAFFRSLTGPEGPEIVSVRKISKGVKQQRHQVRRAGVKPKRELYSGMTYPWDARKHPAPHQRQERG
jgi:hypothetical protein